MMIDAVAPPIEDYYAISPQKRVSLLHSNLSFL